MNESSTFAATCGRDYELVMGRWSERLAMPFLDFAGTKDGELVLDVGCGTGQLARAIASRSTPREVRAIDLAPAYIDYAKGRNRNPSIVFDVGDACAMTFPNQTFNRVLSLLVLHFVPRAAQAISEMRRVAKPGGVVAACVWDVRGGYVASRIFYDTAAALDPKAYGQGGYGAVADRESFEPEFSWQATCLASLAGQQGFRFHGSMAAGFQPSRSDT